MWFIYLNHKKYPIPDISKQFTLHHRALNIEKHYLVFSFHFFLKQNFFLSPPLVTFATVAICNYYL
jgi:hypothetical protein